MILDIWRSFMRVPTWVAIWIFVILVPVNLLSLVFWDVPFGIWIAVLAIGGMMPNLFIMMKERGVSKLMSLPHVIVWTPLVILVAWVLATQELDSTTAMFLIVLLVVDVISLVFDYVDFFKWRRGDRSIA